MEDVLALPLNQLDIGINKRVISLPSEASVLDAMKLMHEQGVGSIAVIDTEGSLLSAVSATDIGRLVATSPDRSVLSVSLSHFISLIKLPQGSTDGEDRYPVYSVTRQAQLGRAIQLLLATNSHRLFITSTPPTPNLGTSPAASPALLPSVVPATTGQSSATLSSLPSSASPNHPSADLKISTSSTSLSSFPTRSAKHLTPAPYGVVSIVDVLAVFARLAGLQDVDPNTVRKHRRNSSAAISSGSADGGGGSGRSTPSPSVSRLRGYSASSDSRIR